MTERNSSFSRLAMIAMLAVAAPFLGSACRTDAPETARPIDSSTQAPSSSLTPDTMATVDSAILVDTGTVGITGAPPAPGGVDHGWKRSELVAGVRSFINAIDSNDQELFWRSIATRSIQQIERGQLGASREEVWTAARQTLGDIQDRRITVIGGSRDSVALQIDGLRLIDSVRTNSPIIVHLLLEKNVWKVMYPGLLYPKNHLLK